MMHLKKIGYYLAITTLVVNFQSCNEDTTNPVDDVPEETTPVETNIEFVSVPADTNVTEFQMASTEISYAQYLEFLNNAYSDGFITYNSSDQGVYDTQGNLMTSLNGSRVVKDHDKDGIYVLEEMENPLNINFMAFDADTESFYIEDPMTVNWEQYFDPTLFPNVNDSLSDWFEFDGDQTTFHGAGDTDGAMPTLEEIKTWPANFIRYYGAHAFADYYGYELPTLAQWHLAGKGGENFEFATSDGTGTVEIAWIGSIMPGWPPNKGHVQPVKSLAPNPLGIYNLGGNVWEWAKDWHDTEGPTAGTPPRPTDAAFFIDDEMNLATGAETYQKALMGGSFNYFTATMGNTWNHSAFLRAGNDHFGFRVVINE